MHPENVTILLLLSVCLSRLWTYTSAHHRSARLFRSLLPETFDQMSMIGISDRISFPRWSGSGAHTLLLGAHSRWSSHFGENQGMMHSRLNPRFHASGLSWKGAAGLRWEWVPRIDRGSRVDEMFSVTPTDSRNFDTIAEDGMAEIGRTSSNQTKTSDSRVCVTQLVGM